MHATRDQLRALATGQLAEAEAAAIEAHLEECEDCSRSFDSIDLARDPLVGLLRRLGSQALPVDPAAAVTVLRTSAETTAPPTTGLLDADGTFSRYRIIRLLGQGGMGVVYQAYDPTLRRHVALKLIDPRRVAREEDRGRFRREAEAAARLQHANIVQVFEFGESRGTLYCAFELVEGGSLAQRLETGALAPQEAAQLVAILADAVAYAHHRHVVHRDLKPANVLFTADGTPKIADFGLAKCLDDDQQQTLDGTLLGSPAYMSPEQAEGNPAQVGPASDVYALGAVLYEVLTGRPPFIGKSLWAVLDSVKRVPPDPPRRVRPELDRDVDTICLKCLEKLPEHRYASAAELASDLRRYLDGMPLAARPGSVVERVAKLVRRHPLTSAFAAVLTLLLLTFAITVTVFNLRLQETLDAANQNAADLEVALEDARRSIYALQLQRAGLLVSHRPQQALELLEDEQKCPPELRDFCWTHLVSSCRRALATWNHGHDIRALAVSPDGQHFVSGDAQGIFRRWSFGAREPEQAVTAHQAAITRLAFSPSGDRLTSASEDGTAAIWSWPELMLLARLEPDKGRINDLAYAPQGEQLATGHSDGRLRVWTADGQMLVADLIAPGSATAAADEQASILGISYSSDGRWLAAGDRTGKLWIWSTENWQLAAEGDDFGTVVRFHPHVAERLVVATVSFRPQFAVLTSAGTLQPGTALRGFTDKIGAMQFSPDGSQLAAASYDGTVRLAQLETGETTDFTLPGQKISTLAFSGRGTLLVATREGTIRHWRTTNLPETVSAHNGRSVTGLAFLAGGRMFSSGGADGSVCLWDTATLDKLGDWSDLDTSITAMHGAGDTVGWESGGRIFLGQLDGERRFTARQLSTDLVFARGLVLGADSEQIVVADFQGLRVWQQGGEPAWHWSADALIALAATPTANRLAAVGEGGTLWISGNSPRELRSLVRSSTPVNCIALSPDGRQLAAGLQNGNIRIFDLPEGREHVVLQGHSQPITALAFSPEGKTVATASLDGEVRLWDPWAGPERWMFSVPQGASSLAFSPTGHVLAVGGNDGSVRLWRTDASAEDD